MSKKLLLILIVFWSSIVQSQTPTEILDAIQNGESKAIVEQYYSDERDQKNFLRNIIDGGSDWVRVGVELLKVTDASYSSATNDALAWHFPRAPLDILPYIKSYELSPSVCAPILFEGQLATPYYLAIEGAIVRLEKVESSTHDTQISMCLRTLNRIVSDWEQSLNK